MNCSNPIFEFNIESYSPLLKNHLKLGGDNAIEKFEVTNRYILRNGKPWIPFMGEYQYSRAAEDEWKTELCKMKAGGINVVACYIIWIHHEEIEGELSFEGNLNLRKFVETAYECGLHVCLRIGPWIHGEVKNGGFPDWLQNKPNLKLRTNDPEYLKYCKKWYSALAEQLTGLMFKDGKPLFAIQIENELTNNEEHITTLLKMAKEVGFDAPIYTATGWGSFGDAQIPQYEVIPMYGGYPEAPWTQHTEKLEPNKNYFFSPIRNDSSIGSDLISDIAGDVSKGGLDYNLYPYATCELGGGNQITYHRRPIIESDDVAAITNVKLGSGVNLVGYYMYHGGRNPLGVTTTTNESKKSGYENDLPLIDYDFQAQLGAWGAVRRHYRTTRIYAMFLEDFGEDFAKTLPHFQKKPINSIFDTENLRYTVRLNDDSGYVFINNFSRKEEMKEHNNVKFNVFGNVFPKGEFNIKDREFGFIPYNMQLGSITLKYSTMQPICKNYNAFFFFAPFNTCDEFCFERNNVSSIIADGDIKYTENEIIVKNIKGNISLIDCNGEKIVIEILSKAQAEHLSRHNGRLYYSDADMVCIDNSVYVYGSNPIDFNCKVYTENGFTDCAVEAVENVNCDVAVKEIPEFYNRYMEELVGDSDAKRKYFEIILPENRENLYLCMDITGDVAQLYADDILLSDAFLNGRNWYVGPNKALNCEKLRLVVSEVNPENKYFETDKTSGLKINQISAKKVYKAKIL